MIRLSLRVLLLFAFSSFLLVGKSQARDACLVADPTGTPLNVRDRPAGKLVNRLRNGRKVFVQEAGKDRKGKAWVRVAGDYKGQWREWGWVFRAYLDCSSLADTASGDVSFPLVFGSGRDLKQVGIALQDYGPRGEKTRHYPHRCYYYGDGGYDLSVSTEYLRRFQARGFTLQSLCLGLVSEARFDPETGRQLPTYILADLNILRSNQEYLEPGVLTDELPLDLPNCFTRGLPLTDCIMNYDVKTGQRLNSRTRSQLKRLGLLIDRYIMGQIQAGNFARECGCRTYPAQKQCRLEKLGACEYHEFVRGNLSREYTIEGPISSYLEGRMNMGRLRKNSRPTFFDISPALPKGYGYALNADGTAGPAATLRSVRLALKPKQRATRAKIRTVKRALSGS